MEKIFFLIITLLTFKLFAQPPGGGGGRGNQGQNQQLQKKQEFRKFSASDVAGIFYYDIEKVVKKIKVKDEKKQFQVKKALRNYNFKIKEILFLNSEKFSNLDLLMNATSKEGGLEMRDKVEEVIRPLRNTIHENEKVLNEKLESFLSEKQIKKWLNYQKNKKESLKPKKPQNNNRQGQGRMQNSGGMRRQQMN